MVVRPPAACFEAFATTMQEVPSADLIIFESLFSSASNDRTSLGSSDVVGWHAHVFVGMVAAAGTCPRRRGHATRLVIRRSFECLQTRRGRSPGGIRPQGDGRNDGRRAHDDEAGRYGLAIVPRQISRRMARPRSRMSPGDATGNPAVGIPATRRPGAGELVDRGYIARVRDRSVRGGPARIRGDLSPTRAGAAAPCAESAGPARCGVGGRPATDGRPGSVGPVARSDCGTVRYWVVSVLAARSSTGRQAADSDSTAGPGPTGRG